MRTLLLPLAALVLTVACSGPKVVPTHQDPSFKLTLLKGASVAVWPIATADLGTSVAETVNAEYTSQNKFLDALSRKLSDRILGISGKSSLSSEKVVETLKASPVTLPLLDARSFLEAQDVSQRFTGGASTSARLEELAKSEHLQGIQYLVAPRFLLMSRNITTSTMGAGANMSTTSSAATEARLDVAIIDLSTRKVVWDGRILAKASSSWMKATAIHEVEDELAQNLGNEILGTPN